MNFAICQTEQVFKKLLLQFYPSVLSFLLAVLFQPTLIVLKEVCYKIYQNWNGGNHH